MKKKHEEKKRRLTYGPNDARHIVWACFSYRRPAKPTLSIYNMNKTQKNEKKMKKNAKKKKRLTYGPNDAFCVVWAHFSHRRPAQPSPSIYNTNKI